MDDLPRMENIVCSRRKVRRGEALFAAGDAFRAVYAVRSGFFKTSILDREGREQVTGFFMSGELLGMEGAGSGRYNGTAHALEDSEACVMPFQQIEDMARQIPALQRRLHAVLSREIVRQRGVIMLLGSRSGEERLAAFLLNLSRRFVRRNFSACEFHLRMTREDIGSYVNLKLETVSRMLSQFEKGGLISVNHRHVRLLDLEGLQRVLAGQD